MASIVSGNTLGLVDTSLYVLGPDGAPGNAAVGRAGERVYVNASTGNLVVQNRDELLVGVGPDVSILRTYNSQGQLDGDNNDNWRIGVYRQVTATGTLNSSASTVTRTDGEGAVTQYTWDSSANRYVNKDGAGGYDTLTYDAASQAWIWTDGSTQVRELYDGTNGGRITQMLDTDGNGISYFYNTAGRMTEARDANGERTYLDYTGDYLTQIRTVDANNNAILTRTHYVYDTNQPNNRLYQIITDLSPEDGSTATGTSYIVTYTYEGTSNRVSTMTQTDGTSLTFGYVQVGSQWKVQSIRDALNHLTTFAYVPGSTAQVTVSADTSALSTGAPQVQSSNLALNTAALQTTGTIQANLIYGALTPAGWSAPALLETASPTAARPIVAYDAAGNAMAVWSQGADIYARRFVNNTWGVQITLDSNANAPSDPNLYVDAFGNAVATWIQSDGAAASVYVARFVNGMWQPAELVETSASAASLASAVINSSGKVIVRWAADQTYANVYTPGTGWSGAVVVGTGAPSGSTRIGPRVAIDASGNGMVVWTANSNAYVNMYSAASGWQGATLLESGTTTITTPPYVSFDGSGNGIAVWSQGPDVFARRYSGGTWAPQVKLNVGSGSLNGVGLYVDPSGNAIAVWVDGSAGYVARFVNGTWKPAEFIGTTALSTTASPSAKINAAGQAAVSWNATGISFNVSRYTEGAGWATDTIATSPPSDSASVAVDARGNITTVYARGSSIYFATYDASMYYLVPVGATWDSVAVALYGDARFADSLRTALGNPPLVAGMHLSGASSTATAYALNTARAPTVTIPHSLNSSLLTPAGWAASTTVGAASSGVQTADMFSGPLAAWASGSDVLVSQYSNYAWSAPLVIDSSTAAVTGPVNIYSNGDNVAIAVWYQGGLYAARCSSGTWQPAELISTAGNVTGYSAAFNGARAAVTWQQGTAYKTYASIYDSTAGGWTAAAAVDAAGYAGNPSNPAGKRVAIDGLGNVFVAWSQADASSGANAYVNIWMASTRTWQGPTLMESNAIQVGDPQVAPDAFNTVNYVFAQGADIVARNYSNGVWAAAKVLDTGTAAVANVRISEGSYALVTWDQGGSIYATRHYAAVDNWDPASLVASGANATSDEYTYNSDVVVWTSGGMAMASVKTSASGTTWSAPFTLGPITAGTTPRTAVDSSGNAVATWVNAGQLYSRSFAGRPYYVVPAGATWTSLATTLYGSASVATLLQNAVGGTPTANRRITNLPASLTETILPNYIVQAGDTWEGIALYLYGSSNVADELRMKMGNIALTPGAVLTPLPASLWDGYSFSATLTATAVVAPYYGVAAGDTWTSLANTLYGNGAAGGELQVALGSPTLAVGMQLSGMPTTLAHSWVQPAPPSYVVQAGDTWASIAVRVYGDRQAADALQLALGSPALVVGLRLAVPPSLTFTKTREAHVDVTDALSQVTSLSYDGAGQLVGIEAPAVGGSRSEIRYTYDADGNVAKVTDARGNSVNYTYDANGNRTVEQDALGNVVSRTFGAKDELLTQTTYPAAGSVQTVRNVYDGENHLRFVISAEGHVTEYQYNTLGQREAAIEYTGGRYDVSALAPTVTLSEAQLAAWVPANRAQSQRTDYRYDFRGQLSKAITYAAVDATGAGVNDSNKAVTQFTYDTAGNLRYTVDARGLDVPLAPGWTTSFLYDGLGRVYAATDAKGNATITTYNDGNAKTVVTLANGLVTTSSYDNAGELFSVVQSVGSVTLGTTQYFYDDDGRLRRMVDPTLVQTHVLYDAAGRRVASIDGAGALTEYLYDSAGHVTRTIEYATPVGTATLAMLFDATTQKPTAATLASIRPAASSDDRSAWNVYDAAGRLVKTVDAAGDVTQQFYDGAGRMTDTVRYADAIITANLGNAPLASMIAPTANAAADRLTRNFYDGDGLLRGTLDGEGYLVEYRYDYAGRLTDTFGYANPTPAALRSTGTLAQLIPSSSPDDIHATTAYNARGQASRRIDGEGYVTDYVYDLAGNKTQEIRYASGASGPAHVATWQYDALNRLVSETNPEGTVTQYTYDSVGNLTKTEKAVNTSDARTINAQYDKQGRLTAELDGNGSAQLTGSLTQPQIDAIWAQWAIKHTYDAAGRRTSTTDADGHRTLFYYDNDGRLTYTVNAMGEVKHTAYSAFGQVAGTTEYNASLPAATLATLAGGLESTAPANVLDPIIAAAATVRYTYYATGDLHTTTDELGFTTTSIFDAFGDVIATSEQTDAMNSTVRTYAYDRRGLRVAEIDDAGAQMPASGGWSLSQVADFDGDGVDDLLWQNADGRHVMWLMNGTVPKSILQIIGAGSGWRVINTGDFNGDGKKDLLWQHTDGSTGIWLMNGTQATAMSGIQGPGTGWSVTRVADINGDGKDDLVWSNTDGRTALRMMDGVTALVGGDIMPAGTGWSVVNTADLNGDGKDDLIWKHTDGSYAVWLMNGMSAVAFGNFYGPGSGWNVAGTGDFNGDGKADLLWKHADGRYAIWLMDGTTMVAGGDIQPAGTGWNVVRIADLDGDGRSDLVWQHTNGTESVWLMNGMALKSGGGGEPTAGWTIAGSGDLNGDGKADLLWKSADGSVRAWLMDGASVTWRDDLSATVAPLNIASSTVYDAFGRAIRFTDGQGGLHAQSYDHRGRVITLTDALNVAQSTSYDAFDRVLTQTDRMLQSTTYVYDDTARTVTVTTPEGVVTTTRHNRHGETFTVSDGRTNTITYTYDADGNLTRIDRPDTGATVNVYDKADLLKEMQLFTFANVLGTKTAYAYDAANRLLVRTVDAGPGGLNLATTYGYDARGRTVTVTDADNVVTRTDYDAKSQAYAVTVDPGRLNLVTTYTYDGRRKVVTVAQPNGAVTKYTYDALGRRIQQQADPSGLNLVTTYEYDGRDDVIATVDPRGNRTRYVRDADGRVAFTVNALGEVQENAYDADDRVTKVTQYGVRINAASVTSTSTVSDVRALVQAAITAAGSNRALDSTETRVYDRDGREVFTIDGNGGVVERAYDGNGNVTRSIAYATAIPVSTAATIAAVRGALTTSASDQSETYFYDRANRKTTCVDAAGAVKTYAYDYRGNVSEVVAYAKAVPGGAAMTEANLRSAAAAGADALHDRHDRYFYDAANRLTTSVDGTGDVSVTEYDGMGRITRTIAYSAHISLAGTLDESTVRARALAQQSAATDRHVRYFYDNAGRCTVQMDSAGAVTTMQYDGAGNLTDRLSYANAATFDANASAVTLPAASSVDRHDVYYYDKANRRTFAIDGAGALTQQVYDAAGNMLDRIRYGTVYTGVLSATEAGMSLVAASIANTTLDAHERFRYDGTNRLTYSGSATGAVTLNVYDARSNVVQRTDFASTVFNADPSLVGSSSLDRVSRFAFDAAGRVAVAMDGAGGATEYIYDALGNVLEQRMQSHAPAAWSTGMSATWVRQNALSSNATDVANNRVERQVFDAAGRVAYKVDAAGHVHKNEFDALGRVVRTVDFDAPLAAGTAMTIAAIDARYPSLVAADREQIFKYDTQGRLTDARDPNTDAGQIWERYTYDAVGNKTVYTDKRGSVWTYDYDAQGNLKAEHSPSVKVSTLTTDATGRYVAQAQSQSLKTSMVYDALGRLKGRTEFDGTSMARLTTYDYDAEGHQVTIHHPAVDVYNVATSQVETGKLLTTQVKYDALGNALWNQDTAGNYSYKTYDLAGRVLAEIDSEGGVTEYARNAFGDATQTLRRGKVLNLTVETQPASVVRLRQLLDAQTTQDRVNDRTIDTTYDAAGRVLSVAEAAVFVYDLNLYSGGGSTSDLRRYTFSEYDNFGEVKRSGIARDANKTGWTYTTFYYDKAGNKVAEVDALGYMTRYDYDAAGNVTLKSEYGKALAAGWDPTSATAPGVPAADSANPDRFTSYTYDKLNRKLTETRVGVKVSDDSGLSNIDPGRNVTTAYTYDAAGNLVTTTTDLGKPDAAATSSFYDAMGRVFAIRSPQRTNDITSAVLSPVTYYYRDAAGNVVQRVDYAADVPDVESGAAPRATTSADHVESVVYDAHGKAIENEDAEGHSKFALYDRGGNMVRQWEAALLRGAAGTILTTFKYDSLGREIEQKQVQNSSDGDVTKATVYNAFGEVQSRTVNGQQTESYSYDGAGRLWRANSGDGVFKVYFQDFSGAVTSEVTSATADLSVFTSARAAWQQFAAMMHTDYRRDALGRAVEQLLPSQGVTQDGNWIPNPFAMNYANVKTMENTWDQFFAGAYGTTYNMPGGRLTMNDQVAGLATFTEFASDGTVAASFQLYGKDGPFAALQRSAGIRNAFGAQFGLSFIQGTPGFSAYLPASYQAYRQFETVLTNWFTTTSSASPPWDWMGGQLIRGANDTATYVDANGSSTPVSLSRGFLGLLSDSQRVREGFSRDYSTYVVGDGGETLQPVSLTSQIVQSAVHTTRDSGGDGGTTIHYYAGTNVVKLAWSSLGALGSGDVKVELTYRRKVYTPGDPPSEGPETGVTVRSDLFAAGAADRGVTINWTDPDGPIGGVAQVFGVRLLKKDVNGDWQEIFNQAPDAPTINTYLFTIPAPTDPAISVSVQTTAGMATPLGNFGGRLLFAPPVSNGNNDYLVWYTLANANNYTWVHSNGTIDVTIPPLEASGPKWIPGFLGEDDSRFGWNWEKASFIGPGENLALKVQRAMFVPSDWAAYMVAESATATYWTSAVPVGDTRDWGGGKMIKTSATDAVFIEAGKGAFRFTSSQSVMELAWMNPTMRSTWEGQFHFTFSQDTNALSPDLGQRANFYALITQFDAYFTSAQSVFSLSRGTLVRTSPTTAQFTPFAGGPAVTFTRAGGALQAAGLSTALRDSFNDAFHAGLAKPPWVEITIPLDSNGNQVNSVDFSSQGPGSFQYELLRLHGSTPYAHAVGIATVKPATTTYQSGIAVIGGTLSMPSLGLVQWNAEAGVTRAELLYRKVGDAAWSSATGVHAVGTFFQANILTSLSTGTYEFEISHYNASGLASHMTGTVPITAAVPTTSTLIPVVSPNMDVVTVPFPDPSNYAYIDESGHTAYTSPVWVGRDESGNPIYGPGYAQGPQIGVDPNTGRPIYGKPIVTGSTTTAKMRWPVPNDGTTKVEVQYRQSGTSLWHTLGVGNSGGYFTDVSGLTAGYYEVQIRHWDYDYETHTYFQMTGHFDGHLSVSGGTPPTFTISNETGPAYITYNGSPMQFGTVSLTTPPAPPTNWGTGAKYSSVNNPIPGPDALSVSAGTGAIAPLITSSFVYSSLASARSIQKIYDRWGNLISQSDPRATPFVANDPKATWTTTWRYNDQNQVVSETHNGASSVSDLNAPSSAPAVTQYLYDSAGRLVATVDPNQNRNRIVYDLAGQVTKEIHADDAANANGTERYGYDAFGNRTLHRDARGNDTVYAYDRDNRLKTETHASTWVDTGVANSVATSWSQRIVNYSYDDAGRRIAAVTSSTAPGSATQTMAYEYDERGNITKSTTDGVATQYGWDAYGNKRYEINGNAANNTLIWGYNNLGQLALHIDLQNYVTQYTYDKVGHVVRQFGGRGQDIRYTYDAAGELVQAQDFVENSVTAYQYDKAGNRTNERFTKAGIVYQDNRNTYDAFGRLTEVVDARHHVWIAYDAAGNRRYIKAKYSDDASADIRNVENWYAYDQMNRVLIENGVWAGNGIAIGPNQGIRYSYDKEGNKTSSTQHTQAYALNGTGGSLGQLDVTDTFEYDAENRLASVRETVPVIPGDPRTIPFGDSNVDSKRTYDGVGRVKTEMIVHMEKSISGGSGGAGADDRYDIRYTDYNANGLISKQTTIDAKGGLRGTATYASYDNAGNLLRYKNETRGQETLTYTYEYGQADESYKTSAIRVWHGDGVTNAAGSTTFIYDANSQLRRVNDSVDAGKNRRFITDASGLTYARADGVPASQADFPLTPDGIRSVNSVNARVRHFLVVDGQTLGITAAGLDGGTPSDTSDDMPAVSRFDFGTHSSGEVAGTASHYVVTHADAAIGLASLKGVAQAVYGDSSLWYVIAEANGITKGNQIVEGMALTVPASVSSARNDATTFRPYDPSDIKGDNMPALPHPQADDGCGSFGAVLLAVVVVVVAVITEQYYLLEYGEAEVAGSDALLVGTDASEAVSAGTATYTTASTVTANVLGSVAANVAGQLVGNAVGTQHGFSWRSVAASAISSGITSGFDVAGLLPASAPQAASIAVRAAFNSAVTQGVNVALGQQHRFSWAVVAASAVMSQVGPVGATIGKAVGGDTGALIGGLAQGVLAQGAMQAARGGAVRWESVAADVFGNALGQSIGGSAIAAIFPELNASSNAVLADASEETASGAQLPEGTVTVRQLGVVIDVDHRGSLAFDNPATPMQWGAASPGAEVKALATQSIEGGTRYHYTDGYVDDLLDGNSIFVPQPLATSTQLLPNAIDAMRARYNFLDRAGGGSSGEQAELADYLGRFGAAIAAGDKATLQAALGSDVRAFREGNTALASRIITLGSMLNPESEWARIPRMDRALAEFGLTSATGVAGMITGGWAFGAARASGFGVLSSGILGGTVGDLTVQGVDNAVFAATDGSFGRSGFSSPELALSAGLGGLPGLPGAVRGLAEKLRGAGMPDYQFGIRAANPGTLYTTPLPPLELQPIASVAGEADPVVLARVNSGKYPYTELNGAIGEAHGWQYAMEQGHVPISAPGKASAPGPDFITYDIDGASVVAWDAKYRSPGGSYPSKVPDEQLSSWRNEIAEAVRNMPYGPDKLAAQRALDQNRITGKIFKWP